MGAPFDTDDPRGFVRTLVLAEILSARDRPGPLARPMRTARGAARPRPPRPTGVRPRRRSPEGAGGEGR
jgi:hypothetical protein